MRRPSCHAWTATAWSHDRALFGTGSVRQGVTSSLDAVLASSVPPQEEAFAREHLPGARTHQAPLSASLVEANRDARVLSLMIHDPIDEAWLDGFEDLEAIVTRSDGFDHLPDAWMRAHEVAGYHLGGYATTSVAHHALMLMLNLIRRVPEARAMALGDPPGWDRSELMGRHLQDVTVGVLGVGKIGSAVSELVTALGGTVRGYDIEPDPELEQVSGFAFVDSLDALLGTSDVLTIHVPLDDATEGMIGADELAQLPEDACLVNTARGAVVDQAAVEQVLEAGSLAGYATDVLPDEPEPPDLKRFQRFGDRVVLTPHLAAYDERTTEARYERTGRIARAIVDGRAGEVEGFRVV